MRLSKAFTLVEMLVVIAILGILSALFLPVFSGAKERARSAACQNNLKQLGMAVIMSLDSNGTWPVQPIDLEDFSQKRAGVSYHVPTNSSIWYCPSCQYKGRDAFGTYLLNRNGCGDVKGSPADKPLGIGKGADGRQGRKEQEIVSQADMIVLAEMYDISITPSSAVADESAAFLENFPFNRSYGYWFVFRHNDRANSLFGDGHVESANRNGLIGENDSVRRRWNFDNQPHDENWRQ